MNELSVVRFTLNRHYNKDFIRTTLSIGYGHLFAPAGFDGGKRGNNEFMISLKLL